MRESWTILNGTLGKALCENVNEMEGAVSETVVFMVKLRGKLVVTVSPRSNSRGKRADKRRAGDASVKLR